ncbi:hypothetical protein, partial [Streptomyces sp. NPDC051162]|uniref:hypothetical protein n=1 Tax=Streptomyces sp. NPDC051162 TaxID=3154747 RepID=UPI0034293BAB
MNDSLTQILIPLALGLILSEFTEVAPWLARRILRLAAHRLDDPEYSERYEAEWVALLDERPGKLLKLFFASWMALRATWELRAIHRPANSSSAGSGTADPQGGRSPRRRQQVRIAFRRARLRWSGGYYRGGRYFPDRRRWGSTAAMRRRRRNAALGLLGAGAWALAGPGVSGVTEAVTVGIVFPLLIALIYPFSRRRLRRLDTLLAADSLQQEDWSLGFVKVPPEPGALHDADPSGSRALPVTSCHVRFWGWEAVQA